MKRSLAKQMLAFALAGILAFSNAAFSAPPSESGEASVERNAEESIEIACAERDADESIGKAGDETDAGESVVESEAKMEADESVDAVSAEERIHEPRRPHSGIRTAEYLREAIERELLPETLGAKNYPEAESYCLFAEEPAENGKSEFSFSEEPAESGSSDVPSSEALAVSENTGTETASGVSPMAAPEEATVLGVTQTVHYLDVIYLLVDAGAIPVDADACGVWSEYPEYVVGGFSQAVEIYDSDPDSDYLAAIVNTASLNQTGRSYTAVFTNADTQDPEVYDFCYYDSEYGVAYIPRSFFFDEEGRECMRSLTCEVVIPLDAEENPAADVEVYMDNLTDKVELVGDQVISAPVLDLCISIPLTTPETAENFDVSLLNLYVNDSYVPYVPREYSFDPETGVLTLDLCSLAVYSIYIVYGDENLFYDAMVYAEVAPSAIGKISSDIFRIDSGNTLLKAGDTFSYQNTLYYAASNSKNGINNTFESVFGSGKSGWSMISPCCYATSSDVYNSYLAQWVQKTGTYGSYSAENILSVVGNLNSDGEIYHSFAYTLPSKGTTISNGIRSFCFDVQAYNYIYGKCIENATGIDTVSVYWGKAGGYEYAYTTETVYIRILAVDTASKTVTMAISSRGFRNASQASVGIYKVEYGQTTTGTPTAWNINATAALTIQKKDSSTGSLLSNAVFGLYSGNSIASANLVKTFTNRNNGTYTASVSKYTGTPQYTIYESTVPTGYNPAGRFRTVIQLENPFNLYLDTLYHAFFGRKADAAGKKSWYEKIMGGISWEDLIGGFVFSSEYTKKNYTNQQFVKDCYEAILLRTADSGGLSTFTAYADDSSYGRAFVISSLIQSEEGQKALTSGKVGNSPAFCYEIENAASNTPYYGEIRIQKRRAEGTDYERFAADFPDELTLAGAVYGVYSSQNNAQTGTDVLMKITTDASGNGTSQPLKLGTYYVKEIIAPVGYQLDPQLYTAAITLSGSQVVNAQVTSREVPEAGKIRIVKETEPAYEEYVTQSSAAYSREGAEFTLYTDPECTSPLLTHSQMPVTVVTEADGSGTSICIPTGTYWVKETKAPLGYEINYEPVRVVVAVGGAGGADTAATAGVADADDISAAAITVYDMPKWIPRYRFRKTDPEHSDHSIAGCSFQLLASDGTVVDSWITDETGIHEILGLLTPGETYTLREIEAAAGYRSMEDIIFVAKASEEWITINCENRLYRGRIFLVKESGTGNSIGTTYGLFSTQSSLGGSRYTYHDRDYYLLEEKAVGENGLVCFSDLEVWNENREAYEFLLLETNAPSGAGLLQSPIYVGTLPRESDGYDPPLGLLSLEDGPEISFDNFQMREGKYYVYDVWYQVRNGSSYELPMTGSGTQALMLNLIPGAMGIAAWLAFTLRKRRS